MRIDFLSAFITFTPAWVPSTDLCVTLYFSSFMLAVLQTARSGYHESLIGHATQADMASRQAAVGRIKTWANTGSAMGFLAAAPLATLSYQGAFALDALTFLMSGLSLCMVPCQGMAKATPSPAFKILLMKPLRWLSLSHGIAAISLFFFNGTAVYVLKDHFHASGSQVSLFFFLQFCGAIAGSWLAARQAERGGIPASQGAMLRALYGAPFLLSACIDQLPAFFAASTCLALVHAFSLPLWQSLFQASSTAAEWRIVGASRKTLVALVGAASSALAGMLYGQHGYRTVFLFAALAAAISARILALHHRTTSTHMKGKNQDGKRSLVA